MNLSPSLSAPLSVRKSRPFQWIGRVGLVAYGVMHFLVAYLALRVAFGDSGETTNKAGAFQLIASQPGGRALLWVMAVGLFALTIWQVAEAVAGGGRTREGGSTKDLLGRVARFVKAMIFLAFGVAAVRFALDATDPGASKGATMTWTGKLMQEPAGRLLVGAIGVAIVAGALYFAYYGLKKKFTRDLDLSSADARTRRVAVRLGQVGCAALGVAYAIVGVLLVAAAVTFDAGKTTGLDAALHTLAGQPFGPWSLAAVALGLACYGAYCLADARYRMR